MQAEFTLSFHFIPPKKRTKGMLIQDIFVRPTLLTCARVQILALYIH